MPDDPLLDKVPPHNLEAEMAVLGAMMIDPEVIGLVVTGLDAAAFYRPEHRTLYELLVEFYDENKPIDLVSVHAALGDRNLLEAVGGREYLVTLAESVPTTASAEYYARLVREKWLLRGLLSAAADIIRDAHAQGEAVDDVLDRSEQRIFEVTDRKLTGEAHDVRSILTQVMQTLDLQNGMAVTGVETGFYDLDDKTRGLQPGNLVILAARPSVGKSAFALNMAEHVAVDAGKAVAFFSLEMSREELALRLLTSRAGVDGMKMRKGTLNQSEAVRVRDALGLLYEVPLLIDDTPALRVIDLRAKARRLIARHEIKLIIVDYLQLMNSPRAENRQVEVSTISRGLKALARELNVPVVALAQLRRETEEHKRPRLSDLRESGALEQDADVVLLLHREEMRHVPGTQEYEEARGQAELIIAKQRNGPTGKIDLVFRHECTRFESWSPQDAPSGERYEPVPSAPMDDAEVEPPF